jgi:SAM-dependent methyltransferase
VPLNVWDPEIAEVYDDTSSSMFDPTLLDATCDVLEELAAGGPALELAVGTGRVALPLAARGVEVHGIELSPHMAAQLRAKADASSVQLTIGDMATTRLDDAPPFALVYLVFNTIMNLTTQDEQCAVFANAAAHLRPGGCFLLEVVVPQLRRLPPGELGRVFTLEREHVGIETFDDTVEQISWSHHWIDVDGTLVHHAAAYRYIWPAELDLMARLAGLRRRDRWAGWDRSPFTTESVSQVVVYEKPA